MADPRAETRSHTVEYSYDSQENHTSVSAWDGVSRESQVQAAGAFDSSVVTEALHVFRNMSTPRPGGLGLVKQAVPLNKAHILEFR